MTQTREEAMLQHALGALVCQALDTPGTVEVVVNSNGTVWHETYGNPMACIGLQMPRQTEAVIRLVASLNGQVVHAERPSLAGTLPTGERFQGWLPPRVKAPAYCIRRPQAQVLTRADYVPACCSVKVWRVLEHAVQARQTILIAGGMSSGKSTLMNALLALVPPTVRICTIEDTAELVLTSPNQLQLYARHEEDLAAVVKEGFRSAAQLVPVGEIRDGQTALHAFKLWLAVGGGIATTHADSAPDALIRLAYLCQEVSPGDYGPLIGGVIDWVVYLETVDGRRRMAEVVQVSWNEQERNYGLAVVG